MSITKNIQNILTEIGDKATLVVAVKYAAPDQVTTVVDAGATDLGFNTYQQMKETAPMLPESAKLHFIGTLQKNKAKKVVELDPALIQSVDSYPLAKKINDAAKSINKTQDILLQVKTDPKKETGILPEDIDDLLQKICTLDNIKTSGLMTVHPYSENPEDSRPYFRQMRTLFENPQKKLEILSMGMSNDYKIAIEEGATMVRVGSRIFR